MKRPALDLSIIGVLYTASLVFSFFQTPLSVLGLAALDGVLTTLPLLLVVFAGIFLCNFLLASGSLARIADWFLSGLRNAFHRELLIALGISNFMEGSGVIAEPVVAPMLRAAGIPPTGAAALSIIGYSGLMTLELAGIIITVLSIVTGIPIYDLGIASAWLSIPATVMMAACIPFFLPNARNWTNILFSILCGFFAGFIALLTAAFIGVSISGMVGGLALMIALVLLGGCRLVLHRQILRDLAPFLFLLAVLLAVTTIQPLKELTYCRLIIPIQIIPVHTITLTPFFSPYVYLIVTCFLSIFLFPMPQKELRPILRKSVKLGLRATITMALFGAMGQIIAYSGYPAGFQMLNTSHNIPWLLAHGLQNYAGGFYPIFVPLLGWVGTFLTGYGVASLMLFGQLQVETAGLMGVSPVWMAAALAVGASLGSLSSPFKIAISAPMCGALGHEGAILRWTIPLGIASSLIIGVILWMIL